MSEVKDGEREAVAVVGCGLMGSAIARCLARGGHRVLAWNRTHARAEALAGDGVTPVRDLAAAVREVPLVIACTASHETTLAALEPVADWSGTTLVDVTSGTPEDAEEMEGWARGRGAAYLDGEVVAYPGQIGLPDCMLIYSGSPAVWSACESTLKELGGASSHLSAAVGAANVVYTAFAGFYSGALGAYVEAVTYTQGNGVPAAATAAIGTRLIGMLIDSAAETARKIEEDDHETDQATILTFLDASQHALPRMQAAGYPFRIRAASLANLEAAAAAGLSHLDFSAQSKVLRGPASHPPTGQSRGESV